jgi:peptide chain release factor 2
MELGDDSLLAEFEGQVAALENEFADRKKELLFNGEYDDHNAMLRITAGVGGTDAQDWAEMLERMYLRWAEKNGFQTTTVERSTGEEAGIKTSVIGLTGPYAYGRLRSENGVHRLVRLSPFNSDNLRQTSFALVEILPQIDAPEEVALNDKDLKIDVYRAGGHGGQSVNTTDSAVRVTHLPTGIVVAIQNERSQLQNKETAMKILRSKLAQLRLEQHAENISDLHAGESANWGSQIRNYVLHPYTLVKDTRTKYEEHDASGVLDGKINGFMTAYLEQNMHDK